MFRELVFLLTAISLLAGSSFANETSIKVNFSYNPTGDTPVTGYRLYQAGTNVCDIEYPQTNTMVCAVNILDQSVQFTLTALFQDGSESPHSAPYMFKVNSISPQGVAALQAIKLLLLNN